jgi:chemotaxis protein methyltransferase CheR
MDGLYDIIEKVSGIDYRGYRAAEGIVDWCARSGVNHPDELERRLAERPFAEKLQLELAPPSLPPFHEVDRWKALRTEIVPLLRTYPSFNVWVPSCGTGEVAYALAIVLYEEGLHDRARIYATDVSDAVLDRARLGVIRGDHLEEGSRAYAASGGRSSFLEYVLNMEGVAHLRPALKERIVFAQHNLVTDASFNEFALIWSAGGLAELYPRLHDRVQALFHESLCRLGILSLGEGGVMHTLRDHYEPLAGFLRRVR